MRTHERIVLCAIALAAGCSVGDGSRHDKPCVLWPEELRPLLQNDTGRIRTGTVVVTDCDPRKPTRFAWRSLDSTIARVDPDGLVRGVRPGVFSAVGTRGADTLRTEGFVLPRGWHPRIHPESATARVGEAVSFRVVAHDSGGRPLPSVPFSLYTPEFLNPGPGDSLRPPLTAEASHHNILSPGVLHVVRPGVTTIIGAIGPRYVEARLVAVPAAAQRPGP